MISKHCRPCRKDPRRLPDIPIYFDDQKAAENNSMIPMIRCDNALDEGGHL
jgi:hypothetical protein